MDIDISTSGTEADKGAHTFTISVDDGTSTISTSVTLTFYSWDTTFEFSQSRFSYLLNGDYKTV